jgi:ABC-type glutathione transport system ATPase component
VNTRSVARRLESLPSSIQRSFDMTILFVTHHTDLPAHVCEQIQLAKQSPGGTE